MNNSTNIIVRFIDYIPSEQIEEYAKDLDAPGLQIEISQISKNAAYASIEWALPTVIGVYILKPYFDGFLKEMAKDHYILLKKWLSKVSTDFREVKTVWARAGRATDKLSLNNMQSTSFAIHSRLMNGQQIKFLFNDN